ncbi:putative 3beta-hydroxysteroid-4alpha-carboxylate 3-dehydrogenase [Microsporum ferrugineum]
MDPVLVIGGCGGLGHTIIKQLLQKGDASNITALDITTKHNIVPGAKYIEGSFSSPTDIRGVLEQVKPRVIFHTASPLLMQQKNTQELYEKVNIEGNRDLIRAIREQEAKSVKALVYTSSSSVIHNGFSHIIEATEDLPKVYYPEQPEFYSHTKAVAEDIILEANRKDGLLTVVIRGTTLFGEGEDGVIPHMIDSAKSGRSKIQVGNGENLFDFTYHGNAAYAQILAAKALLNASGSPDLPPEDRRVDGEAFVVTNDEHVPFWSFVHAVAAAAGYPVAKKDIRVVPWYIFYIMAVVAEWAVWLTSLGARESKLNRKMVRYLTMTRTFDITKLKTRLGYRPQIGIHDAINHSVEEYFKKFPEQKRGGN